MPQIKLGARKKQYYAKLFAQDKNYYTVVDSLKQLPMFEGRFADDGEVLAFVDFLSNIFHICWQSDVFDTNHMRLMDILFGFQHAIEFGRDKEAAQIIETLLSRFAAIYTDRDEAIERRVFIACKDLIERHQHEIPQKETLNNETAFFTRLSREYTLTWPAEILASPSAKTLPDWPLGERQGITVKPLTNEAMRFDRANRQKDLARLGERLE